MSCMANTFIRPDYEIKLATIAPSSYKRLDINISYIFDQINILFKMFRVI